MRIRTRTELPCSPDAAWRALHDPSIAAGVYAPAVVMAPVNGSPWPDRWGPGDAIEVSARAFGVVTLGRQLIRIRHARVTQNGRAATALVDDGGARTGPLALARTWDHRMWVTADAVHVDHDDDGAVPAHAIWHDRLTIGGPFAWLLAPVLWTTWRLRALRLRRLAWSWA